MKKPAYLLSLALMSTATTIFPAHNVLAEPKIGNCSVFPVNNIWNTPVDTLPVDSNAQHQRWIDAVGRNTKFHMDFAAGEYQEGFIGIPYNVVDRSTLSQCSAFSFLYAAESDKGGVGCYLDGLAQPPSGYAIPASPVIESGSDHHLITVDSNNCTLYEVFNASYNGRKMTGTGDSGATWSLSSNALRPRGWTSADAAGLPILPGLIRYDEAASGSIKHAIRFTVPVTDGSFIWPARHKTSTSYVPKLGGPVPPPMGAHLRLKKSYVINSALKQDVKILAIIKAMQTYGIINADNGSAWFVTGEPNANWNDTLLKTFSDSLTGNDFEPVDTRCMMVDENSGEADVTRCSAVASTAVASVADCAFSISPKSVFFSNISGKGSVNVTASAASCDWSVQSNNAWVESATTRFTGSQTVSYSVSDNNTGIFRIGSISIANAVFIIVQSF
ncbi:MAG: BACON domain-containing protein [Methylococcales bacterium]|nr:BACON domain-containing protein [Methylococcales bacterium]